MVNLNFNKSRILVVLPATCDEVIHNNYFSSIFQKQFILMSLQMFLIHLPWFTYMLNNIVF